MCVLRPSSRPSCSGLVECLARGNGVTARPGCLALIIPALNEADSFGRQLARFPREIFFQIIVVDNGSQDGTAEVARSAGAPVVVWARRGDGGACCAGLAQLRPEVTAVVFMDGDLSDDPGDVERLVRVFAEGEWDLVVGSRVLGRAEPGSLTPWQYFGNWLTTRLIRWLWRGAFSPLGPLRNIRR